MQRVFIFTFLGILSLLTSCRPLLPLEKPRTAAVSQTIYREEDFESLRIYAIDVGQGDATLVIGPSGKTLLIDSGPVESGRRDILPLMNALHIDALNWIVLTHYDADHIGGLSEVLQGEDEILGTEDDFYPLFALYDRGEETDKNTQTYQTYAQITAPVRRPISPNTLFDLGHGAFAKVIVVNGDYSDNTHIHLNPNEENESSIGLLIQYGNFKYFTAGDLSGGGAPGGFETKDLETHAGNILGDIDVLHAGHHGSASSSNLNFLNHISPVATILSVGRDNDYHHPAEATLERLESVHSSIFRTDEHGTILVETDGSHYEIK